MKKVFKVSLNVILCFLIFGGNLPIQAYNALTQKSPPREVRADASALDLNVPKPAKVKSNLISPTTARVTIYYKASQITKVKSILSNKRNAGLCIAIAGGVLNKYIGAMFSVANIMTNSEYERFQSALSKARQKHKGLEIKYDWLIDSGNGGQFNLRFKVK